MRNLAFYGASDDLCEIEGTGKGEPDEVGCFMEKAIGKRMRYWLFGGCDYYPSGGMGDFIGEFPSQLEAEEAGKSREWCEVIDMVDRVRVSCSGKSCREEIHGMVAATLTESKEKPNGN